MASRDLPVNRLATTDATGARVWLYPTDVRGRFRRARTTLFSFLIVLLLALPWISIGGRPAVLLDIPGRRFAFFGLTLWAHDAPILLFILLGTALALVFATAVFGRVWCGWACPQTVFIDGVFRRIERWIEGDALARQRLDQAPMSAAKFFKKTLKWLAFTLVSLVISHSLLAYFVGGRELLGFIVESPVKNWSSFLIMAGVTGTVLFDFGWFREQFCTIACPYGRLQSVLMDSRSLAVLYDPARGEPRKGLANPGEKQGDCVNCYRCVHVCPTGIDIRRGVQLECIACTACIDACDDVMTRMGKERGLIRYDSEANMASTAGKRATLKLTTRSWIYGAILLVVFAGLTAAIQRRQLLDVTLTRATEAPYIVGPRTDQGTKIINHFRVDFSNQSFEDMKVAFELPTELRGRGFNLVMPTAPLLVRAGKAVRTDFFVEFPDTQLSAGHANAVLEVVTEPKGVLKETLRKEVHLVGPFQ